MKTFDNDIRNIEDFEDNADISALDITSNDQSDAKFHDNLAVDHLSDETLKRLAIYLTDQTDKDIEASKPWFDAINRVKKVLGFDIEDLSNVPFKHATRTFDTTLATSLIRFYSFVCNEMLLPSGPAGFRVNGIITDELEEKGDKVRDFLNYYLTVVDKPYYSDFQRFILHLGFNGCGFKKVYQDPILKRPLARFIVAEDFLIDGSCTSILDSNRLTHVLHLSKREILLNQQSGVYRDVELSIFKRDSYSSEDKNESSKKEDFDNEVYDRPSLFSIYECHAYLNLDEFESGSNDDDNESIPLPYIITFEPKSKEVLSIRRNWDENDLTRERLNYFVQYNYLAGFGVRGLGLAHLLGSNAISLTTLQRELIDAGQFKNLPAGFYDGALKSGENDFTLDPGVFKPLKTGGASLKEFFIPLPFGEPSSVLRELRLDLVNQTKELGSSSELGMLESKEDIPTGTMMAALEEKNRIQSAVLKSIHYSLTQELQLIDKLFRRGLTDDFSEVINGVEITNQDFADEIEIIPISDPSTNSTVQRIIKAQAINQLAMQYPDLHNRYEVCRIQYKAQGIDEKEIDKILKPDPSQEETEILPLDPVSENLNIMNGKPVKAAMWQNHPAHKYDHAAFGEKYPEFAPQIMAHNREHDAMQYLIDMQQLLGFELPPLEELMDPQIQNNIAMAIAEKLDEMRVEDQPETPIDPNSLLLADIQQKEAETVSREKIANLRAETDIFKAQLDFEKEKAKIESSEDIAKLKSETELTKQGVNTNV
jgi:hypothetical protein